MFWAQCQGKELKKFLRVKWDSACLSMKSYYENIDKEFDFIANILVVLNYLKITNIRI